MVLPTSVTTAAPVAAPEGATLRVHRSPLTFSCGPCAVEFSATREELEAARCPQCESRDVSLVSGTGYTVESMEAQ